MNSRKLVPYLGWKKHLLTLEKFTSQNDHIYILKENLIYETELQQTAFRRKNIVPLLHSPKPVFSTIQHYARKETTDAEDPIILHQDLGSHLMCMLQAEYSYLLLKTGGILRKTKVHFTDSS